MFEMRKTESSYSISKLFPNIQIDTLFDSGSQANLIYADLVKKMNLETMPHHKSYPSGWITKDANLQVTRKCVFRFAIIANIIDEVELDVVPLDISGILLGNLYLYDMKDIFHRFENKYHLFKKNIVRAHRKNLSLSLATAGCDVKLKAELVDMVNQYGDMFQETKGFPPKRGFEHKIKLQQNCPLPNIGMYRMSIMESLEIKKQVQKLLDKGVIRPSTSPCDSPIVLVRKKDGTWCMCLDYQALNKITINNQYPLPRIDDFLDQLKNAKYFTKLDSRSGYHQVRIAEEDIWKTACKTKQGFFEWLVMPFGLCNASDTFMRVVNDVLRSFIDEFVIVYLDDILIFNKS
eukprot:PITA_30335